MDYPIANGSSAIFGLLAFHYAMRSDSEWDNRSTSNLLLANKASLQFGGILLNITFYDLDAYSCDPYTKQAAKTCKQAPVTGDD